MKRFQLVAGNVALDLVNTLDSRFADGGPEELLESYDDLLQFCNQSGLLTPSRMKQLARTTDPGTHRLQVLRQVRELREAVSTIAYSFVDQQSAPRAAFSHLQSQFAQAREASQFVLEGGRCIWKLREEEQVATPLWLLAAAAEALLTSNLDSLRSCGVESCRWLFLDTSKSGTRRWCDMKICGNRVKARRFQARQAGK